MISVKPGRYVGAEVIVSEVICVKEAIARFGEDEYDLVTAYATLDDNGRPLFTEDGTFVLANPEKASEFLDARTELLASVAEVSGPTYDGHDKDV